MIVVLLAKSQLNATKFLISNALINSSIGHDEPVSVNNVLKEYNEMKKAIKNSKIFNSDNI